MLVSVRSLISGFEGGPGNVDGSGVRWKITAGLVGAGSGVRNKLIIINISGFDGRSPRD